MNVWRKNMAPVCHFFHLSPQDYWAMRVRDLRDLVEFMNEHARQQQIESMKLEARADAKAKGRSGRDR